MAEESNEAKPPSSSSSSTKKRKAGELGDPIEPSRKRLRFDFFSSEEFVTLFPTICEAMPWDLPTLLFSTSLVNKTWSKCTADFLAAWYRDSYMLFVNADLDSTNSPSNALYPLSVANRKLGGPPSTMYDVREGVEHWRPRDHMVRGPSAALIPSTEDLGEIETVWCLEKSRKIPVWNWIHPILKKDTVLALCMVLGYLDLALDRFSRACDNVDVRDALSSSKTRFDVWNDGSDDESDDESVDDRVLWCHKDKCYCKYVSDTRRAENEAKERDVAWKLERKAYAMSKLALRLGEFEFLSSLDAMLRFTLSELPHYHYETENWLKFALWPHAFFGKRPYETLRGLWKAIRDSSTRIVGVAPFKNPVLPSDRMASETSQRLLWNGDSKKRAMIYYNEALHRIDERHRYQESGSESRSAKKSVFAEWLRGKYYRYAVPVTSTFSQGSHRFCFTVVKFPFLESVPMEDHYALHFWLCKLVAKFANHDVNCAVSTKIDVFSSCKRPSSFLDDDKKDDEDANWEYRVPEVVVKFPKMRQTLIAFEALEFVQRKMKTESFVRSRVSNPKKLNATAKKSGGLLFDFLHGAAKTESGRYEFFEHVTEDVREAWRDITLVAS